MERAGATGKGHVPLIAIDVLWLDRDDLAAGRAKTRFYPAGAGNGLCRPDKSTMLSRRLCLATETQEF
jgi:hypothetical protein